MICNKCFSYDVRNNNCAERHNMPADEEKCFYFTSQVEIALSQEEIWAILDMYLYVRERGQNAVLSSFYDKVRMAISPSRTFEKEKILNLEER